MAACPAWITFHHAARDNGCMRIIPNSHKVRHSLSHFSSAVDDIVLHQEIEEHELPNKEPVDIVLEPGMV